MTHMRATGRGPELAEVPPRHCGNGHKLGPGRVLIGSAGGGYSPRTYLCRVCGMLGTVGRGGVVEWRQGPLSDVIRVPE